MFGDHAAYIVPSYAATLVIMGGLIVWIRSSYSYYKKELRLLNAKGIKRASAK